MSSMKAVNYVGPHKVKVEEVEKPKLEHPDDIIVKVTTVSDIAIKVHGPAEANIASGCYLWLGSSVRHVKRTNIDDIL